MSFYHDVKEHMSPSALAQWLGGRGQFVRSYFAGEKSPETKAMTGGTEIHALVEAGIIKAKHVYEHAEDELKVQVPNTDFYFLGRPDSWGDVVVYPSDKSPVTVSFVDYKSGKANGWDEKLPTDIKMRATAWLVWRTAGEPEKVHGFVEFIQTTWDPEQKKVVPLDGVETAVSSITYTADEMHAFTKVIIRAMEDANAFYEKWKESTGDFVSKADVARSVELRKEIAEREMELDAVDDRILSQMEFGGEETHKVEGVGTYFIKTSKTYEYPKNLKINYLDMGIVLEDAEAIASATKAAKTNYELANDPKETKRSVSFRAAKER